MAKKITIKDIANQAQMSLATVSGVLNGETRFSEKTRKHVWEIANRLNYVPSESARGLRSGSSEERRKTGVIMHIVHMRNEVPKHDREQEADVYRLAWQARQHGLFVIPYCYYRPSGFQSPPLLNGLVDGAIIGTPHLEVVNTVKAKVPVVLMDVPFSAELVDVPMVNVDHRYGFMMALQKLKELGHRRVVLVACIREEQGATSIEKGISRVFAEAAGMIDVEVEPELGQIENISPEIHEEKMTELAQRLLPEIRARRITAIFGAHVCYVLSLKRALGELGVRVPEEVSMLGPFLGFEPMPGISNIFANRSSLIEVSLELLQGQIAGQPLHCYENLVRPESITNETLAINSPKNQ